VTRTEDRLIDALAAVGRSVQEETLPPLPARSSESARQRWGRWLAPLAAAASVILIVVLVSGVHLLSAKSPGSEARIARPPRYYVTQERTAGGIQVHDTATGAVTASIPSPFSGHGSFAGFAAAVAAGGGGREFVAEYSGSTPQSKVQTRLYTFRLTSAGRVAGFSLVNGGPVAGYVPDGALAVSADGSKVALSVYRPTGTLGPPPAPKIVVIDLRTGARSFWAGGLHRAGFAQTILSISWGPGSDALTFLSQWCHNSVVLRYCGFGQHFAQVRTLRLVPGGGRLSAGSLLLSESAQRSYMVQELLSPDGKALTIAVLGPPYLETGQQTPQVLQVSQVPLAGGRPRLLYRGAVDGHIYVFLGSDSSGRHLLLAGAGNGWIDHGRLRPLPPQGGVVSTDAW
jgi:hypothetical protein